MVLMRWIRGGVTAAAGFTASGISAGIKRSRKPDLSLVLAERPCSAAGVFTRNIIKAPPVLISRERLSGGLARAVLINSGCANCMTGAAGRRDALAAGAAVADACGIPRAQVLLASTGLIGTRLPVVRLVRAVPRLVRGLSRGHHEAAAQAILTTDLRIKEAAFEARLGGARLRVGGMAKGAGMIAPSMATMLAVLTTDAVVAPGLLRRMLHEAVSRTFNRVTVDGDTSTNDTVFVMASGRSGVVAAPGTRALALFSRMLEAVSAELAKRIVQDGEGATRIMDVRVAGARSAREAHAAAQRVANSPLVKTMLAGGDPNVGRIAAALGASGAGFTPERLEIRLNGRPVVIRGLPRPLDRASARQVMRRPEVLMQVDLHAGDAEGRALSCDLTEEYVRINAHYST